MGKIIFKIWIVFLCVFLSQFFSSQTYELVYAVEFKPKIGSDSIANENYILRFDASKKKSIFIFTKDNNLNTIIHKKFAEKEFLEYESILQKFYHSNFSFDPTKWKLINDEKIILGYTCRKGTINFGDRDWEAWYTTDIPFSDGPYKFSGLPGLILEIKSVDNDYSFSAIALQKTNNEILNNLNSTFIKTDEKKIELKKQIIKDPASQYRAQVLQLKNNNMSVGVTYNGKTITNRDIENSIIKDFNNWMKENNNPIEKDKIWIK